MKKACWFIGLMLYWFAGHAQSVEMKLAEAVQQLEKDSQMRHAILGFAVADAKTGAIVYARNEQTGLAPASTQKIITSAAAFELLGNNFRYKTQLGYSGKVDKNGVLNGHLYIIGSGDPTLGSWRYAGTKDSFILKQWVAAIKKSIRRVTGGISFYTDSFSLQSIPDGWIWQDIGNYYGAGAYGLNWKENQYELILRSGDRTGERVDVVRAGDILLRHDYDNELKAAGKGSGDNAYIYLPVHNGKPLVKGTIPVGEKAFSISGAAPDPAMQLHTDLAKALSASSPLFSSGLQKKVLHTPVKEEMKGLSHLHMHLSPSLDSINYWFMRRSINLYGEALIKTIAFEKAGYGDTDTGVRLVRDFWAERGIDKAAINIMDGSGLSPQNRVTADALVKVLQFAATRPWHASFYESLPTYNGMKLKSGSIGGARAFAGYHTSAQGKEYVIAIIVNNYTGSSGDMVRKMYKVLDVLK